MASYFDEHNCQPLPDGQMPDHALMLARFLLDSGHIATTRQWDNIFPNGKPPPTSKAFIAALEEGQAAEERDTRKQCPICLNTFASGEKIGKLPCDHSFHLSCLLPWLNQASTCPLCRHDLPTDDKSYEEYKKYKKRESQRKAELEALHDNMFS